MGIIYVLVACTFFHAPGTQPNEMSVSCITMPPSTLSRCLVMSDKIYHEGVLRYTSCVQFAEDSDEPFVPEGGYDAEPEAE